MKSAIRLVSIAATACALCACAGSESYESGSASGMRQAGSGAESACMVAINSNYGGKVKDLKVVSSEYSEANSLVMIQALGVRGGSASERWRCLVSNDGRVQDLSVAQ